MAGKPIIDFVASSLDLILLNEAPDFSEKNVGKIELSQTKAGMIASTEVNYPASGDLYGQIIVESLGMDEPLFFGDDSNILSTGAGQFVGSVFPGEKGTTLIGGHNSSGFGKLVGIQNGDIVEVKTTYGIYQYKVTETKIMKYNTEEVTAALGEYDEDRLLLYTCYPVNMLGLTDDRFFVFATYESGPEIDGTK